MDDHEVWLISNGDYWKAAWTGADGQRRSRSIGPKSKYSRRQAKVRAREIARGAEADAARPTAVPRLNAWLSSFIAEREVADTTKATYREAGTYLRAYFDNDPSLDAISRADAAQWRAELAAGKLTDELNAMADRGSKSHINGAGRAWRKPQPPTVARHVRFAKMLFAEAVDRDLITFNPFDRLKGNPPAVRKDWRQITAVDIDRINDACPNDAWRLLFGLCRFAGLRLGEALRLRWQDVDLAGNRMVINADVMRQTTKKRRRVSPIEPARCPSGLLQRMADALAAAAEGSVLVCGGEISRNNVRRDALGILRRSGVGIYAKPFHTLRKCCETDWAQQYPQGVVSEWIGHDITVSQDHYLRVPAELYALPRSVQTGHERLKKQRKPPDKPAIDREGSD